MKKLSLTLISILCAIVGFAQSQCSQLNASFTLTQNNPSVTLTRTSTFPTPVGNSIHYFMVNWGDNPSWNYVWAPNATASHTYATPGTYNITMQQHWIDSTGTTTIYCADTAYQTVSITLPPCNASISSVNNGGGSYTFTANNLGGGSNTYSWNFGDGGTGTGSPITHTYVNSGNYNVTLVSTGGGCSHTSTQNLNVFNGTLSCNTLSASFSTNSNGNTAYFYNNSTYVFFPGQNIKNKATWDFGDGSPAMIHNYPTHNYLSYGNYTVIMTNEWVDSSANTILCTDTAIQYITITPAPPASGYLYGWIIYDSSLLSSPIDFKVWLISYDSGSNMLSAIDSLITSASMSSSHYYDFGSIPSQTYYVKAKVNSSVNPGFIPTYHLSSATWGGATSIYVPGNSYAQANINMISGTPTSGPGFIGGNVSQGAGKGTNTGIPNLLMLLRNANNDIIADAYTDVNGDYSFGSIPTGSYTIYPEEMNYHTTPSSNLTIGSGTNTYSAVDFEKNSTTIKPKTTGIKDIVNNVFSIYPNPSKGQLHINWKNGVSGDAQVMISDISGRVIYNQSTSTKSVIEIDLTKLNQGVYFIKVNTSKGQHTERIVLQ